LTLEMSGPAPSAAIVGVSALSAFGFGWRGLGQALLSRALAPAPSRQLARSHPGTLASEVPPIPASEDVAHLKSRKLMSRSAQLAAIAMRKALEDAGWSERREEIGCFLGIGASGGPMEELAEILRASVRDGRIDSARFCTEGLAAANPLLAFHLLSNFILCHGAIATGVAGPNRAFYSRGAGTVLAIREALYSLEEGDCERTLAGGADSALHLATFVELALEGFVARGFVPGEGAAMLALQKQAAHPLAFVEVPESLPEAGELAILVPWGPPARDALELASARFATRIDLSLCLGDPLGANVALACAAAVDLLGAGKCRSAVVLCTGVDGTTSGLHLRAGGER
jgi:hypothetical protein